MAATSSRRALGLLALVATACASSSPQVVTPKLPAAGGAQASSHEADPQQGLAHSSVPLFFPSYTTPCNDEGSVKGIMKAHMSPALSQVSEAIFHAQNDEEARMKAVSDAAAIMLGCAPLIAQHARSLHDDSWPTFDHFLHQTVVDINALQNAAMEDGPAEVEHWYHHVKQDCASCHSRFWKR